MKGHCFVTMADTAQAAQALEHLHGYQLKGKPIMLVSSELLDKSAVKEGTDCVCSGYLALFFLPAFWPQDLFVCCLLRFASISSC